MPSTAVIGLQWGDEGKGKIIDSLSAEADMIVRFAGGNNAGHTVHVGSEKYVLHLIPGGILHEGKKNIIGRGVVVNLDALIEEIDGLEERGVPVSERLFIDSRVHLIFPYHCQLDGLAERGRGEAKIGTTGRGIGPAYSDKVARTGIRLADAMNAETFAELLTNAMEEKNNFMRKVYGVEPENQQGLLEKTLAQVERLRPLVVDGGAMVRKAHATGERILFEGAQGLMLDLDAGTYPFVTSSWTGLAGVSGGAGFPPNRIDRALAVSKAYCTRVGSGPFPSELDNAVGQKLRDQGNEYGATTGRPRRCGWFDAVQARYACSLNGLDGVFLTNLDVLSGFEELAVCVGYRFEDGTETTEFPGDLSCLSKITPVFKTMPGWSVDITAARSLEELPETCRAYVAFLEDQMQTTITTLSVGPGRDQLFECEPAGAPV
ncbi:MAG: adenylosuccinate synthase [Planctomycetota bacterium]|nr:adenylosuccinate synthase [Planctomycetota bacterium]MDA1112771.1 adenylosuccinate synthase [Planctomycetota bacterium]